MVQNYQKDRYTLSGKKLTITRLTAEQSYKVDIVGATDFANNIANPIAVNFTVLKETLIIQNQLFLQQ